MVLEVDRKDNFRGYFPDNMVFACRRCNTVKNAYLTYDQMKAVAETFFKPEAVIHAE
jgi:5-methylcytosine-specific restriction endonuclease McrA